MILIQHKSEKKLWVYDTSLSLQAKGLMLVFMTQFENGKNLDGGRLPVIEKFTNGDKSFRNTFEELILHNYLRRSRLKDGAGIVSMLVWEVFDEPSSERITAEAIVQLNNGCTAEFHLQ